MSTRDESEFGSVELEVRRVRWRYVKGGLRIVILVCAGGNLVSDCAACGITASVEIDAIAGRWSMIYSW